VAPQCRAYFNSRVVAIRHLLFGGTSTLYAKPEFEKVMEESVTQDLAHSVFGSKVQAAAGGWET